MSNYTQVFLLKRLAIRLNRKSRIRTLFNL